ncbi:hypothetical protein MD588_22415 [Photobacterium sp. SDRW27]|uniref:hypothetical protein n=1 Tax=Photobacterium obscurum TaxID=2829490 RepID=UPI00224464E1|nr:hypothetical protein [Photobacterium obscurum]MCW8331555.1 hypothetical protein [Photobacterium obscurum]
MKAALWTKLKCAGPLQDFDNELQRFLYWLDPRLRPLVVKGRKWQQRYRQASGVEAHLDIERQALQDLRHLSLNIPEQPLIDEFLSRVEYAHSRSLAARQAALSGKNIDLNLDDELIDALLIWLATRTKHRETAAWLSRMLRAWRPERN